MLTRRHRFHGRAGLTYVYRHGSVVRGPQITLRYARSQKSGSYRLAVTVSRKVHKSAVKRNRLRRRIYEIVRTGPVIAEPIDMVIAIFSDQLVDLTPPELERVVRNLFMKAKLYQHPKPQPQPAQHGIVKTREDQR